MKTGELIVNIVWVVLTIAFIAGFGWLVGMAGKSLGYEKAMEEWPALMELERPTRCEATSSFRITDGQVLVTLLCPDSIGPRPKDPERRHE